MTGINQLVCRLIVGNNKGHGGFRKNMSSRKLYLNRSRDNNEVNLMAIHELL